MYERLYEQIKREISIWLTKRRQNSMIFKYQTSIFKYWSSIFKYPEGIFKYPGSISEYSAY